MSEPIIKNEVVKPELHMYVGLPLDPQGVALQALLGLGRA